MFIELTDHLRCPVEHEERYLVLLPDRIEERSVREGRLGCPVCGRTYVVRDGELDFMDGAATEGKEPGTGLTVEAMGALAGISGPGGYLVLVGAPGNAWRELAKTVPKVGLVAVNPGRGTRDEPGISVLRSARVPLKSHSMRGVVLGRPYGADPHWVGEAARVVLPGLRVVGEGGEPSGDVVDLMATAGGVWVGTPHR